MGNNGPVGMNDSRMHMELLLLLLLFFKGRLVPELPSMACDFYAAIISPVAGPGAPSQ